MNLDNKSELNVSRIAIIGRRCLYACVVLVLLFIFFVLWSGATMLFASFITQIAMAMLFYLTIFVNILAIIMILVRKKSYGCCYAIKSIAVSVAIVLLMNFLVPWRNTKHRLFLINRRPAYSLRYIIKEPIDEYVKNNDGYLPVADKWIDSLRNYSLGDLDLKSLRHPDWEGCFVFNKNISGLKLADIPDTTVLVFEANAEINNTGGEEMLRDFENNIEFIYMLLADGRVIKYRLSDGAVAEPLPTHKLREFKRFKPQKESFEIYWKP